MSALTGITSSSYSSWPYQSMSSSSPGTLFSSSSNWTYFFTIAYGFATGRTGFVYIGFFSFDLYRSSIIFAGRFLILSTTYFSADSDAFVILPVISLYLEAFLSADGFGVVTGAPFSLPSRTAILLSRYIRSVFSLVRAFASSLYFPSTTDNSVFRDLISSSFFRANS